MDTARAANPYVEVTALICPGVSGLNPVAYVAAMQIGTAARTHTHWHHGPEAGVTRAH